MCLIFSSFKFVIFTKYKLQNTSGHYAATQWQKLAVV
jgi:hypothetical protein